MSVRRRLFPIFLGALLAAGSAASQPAMWTVHTSHATLTLFGSIHLLPPNLDWESNDLRQAVAGADEIWFELPINVKTDADVTRAAARKAAWPRGDNLYHHLTTVEGEQLAEACRKLGLPAAAVAPMRPWLAEVMLSVAQDMRESGASAESGVEREIAAQARPGVRRKAFESASQQIDFLANAPLPDQLSSLKETLDEITTDPDLYGKVLAAWMSADLPKLKQEAIDPIAAESPTLYRRLITDRNQRWAKTLSHRLRGRGHILVVVGAGHLLGPGGLPELLRERGFEVDGPGFPAH